jgi:hypothetical protein
LPGWRRGADAYADHHANSCGDADSYSNPNADNDSNADASWPNANSYAHSDDNAHSGPAQQRLQGRSR